MEFKSNKNGLFYKYNKITQQKKFHLLNLVLKERRSIKQAARIVEINYSTAKTIVFFHRNHLKSYQFDFSMHHRLHKTQRRTLASYAHISPQPSTPPSPSSPHSQVPLFTRFIQIVSTIGSKTTNIDFNSLQTRFMDNHLDHTNSYSPKDYQLMNTVAHSQVELKQMQICQCERRTTRAQSAKQAAKVHFYPAIKQEHCYGDACSQQQKKQ